MTQRTLIKVMRNGCRINCMDRVTGSMTFSAANHRPSPPPLILRMSLFECHYAAHWIKKMASDLKCDRNTDRTGTQRELVWVFASEDVFQLTKKQRWQANGGAWHSVSRLFEASLTSLSSGDGVNVRGLYGKESFFVKKNTFPWLFRWLILFILFLVFLFSRWVSEIVRVYNAFCKHCLRGRWSANGCTQKIQLDNWALVHWSIRAFEHALVHSQIIEVFKCKRLLDLCWSRKKNMVKSKRTRDQPFIHLVQNTVLDTRHSPKQPDGESPPATQQPCGPKLLSLRLTRRSIAILKQQERSNPKHKKNIFPILLHCNFQDANES